MLLMGVGGRKKYADRVRSILGSALHTHYEQTESSGTAMLDSGPNARHGSYTGATVSNKSGRRGVVCPFFDGIDDTPVVPGSYLSNFSVTEGTFLMWYQVSAASVWTDAVYRVMWGLRTAGDVDVFDIVKLHTPNHTIRFSWRANSVYFNYNYAFTPTGTTEWFCIATTWSQTENYIRRFINGAQIDAIAYQPWSTGTLSYFKSQWIDGWTQDIVTATRAATNDEVLRLSV